MRSPRSNPGGDAPLRPVQRGLPTKGFQCRIRSHRRHHTCQQSSDPSSGRGISLTRPGTPRLGRLRLVGTTLRIRSTRLPPAASKGSPVHPFRTGPAPARRHSLCEWTLAGRWAIRGNRLARGEVEPPPCSGFGNSQRTGGRIFRLLAWISTAANSPDTRPLRGPARYAVNSSLAPPHQGTATGFASMVEASRIGRWARRWKWTRTAPGVTATSAGISTRSRKICRACASA